ncbi:hypothetical protein GCM10027048_21210 [Hymenobacter coalescens]
MEPSFVVLTDLSRGAEAALTYTTRLAALLAGRLVLLHVYQDPFLEPEAMMVAMPAVLESRQQIKTDLAQRARQLPVPADTELSVDTLTGAVADAVQRHHPLLLVLGREQPEYLLDRLLPHHAAAVLQEARYPLLLVPASWPEQELPRRVLVASDEHGFWLTAPALALADLLRALQATTTVVHVAPADGPSRADVGLAAVQRTGLFGPLTANSLYEVRGEAPVEGILHAAAELRSQLIVVVARQHSLLGGLLHRSVTGQLLHRSPVPVLVLPTTT